MASEEVTGATKEQLAQMESEYYETPLYQKDDIPFEVAYCLNKIGKQPDDYDGPQRWCKKRTSRKDGYDRNDRFKEAYAKFCRFHGGDAVAAGHPETLENPLTVSIKHGGYAEDEHLKMDFDEEEQSLYDDIMKNWPDIYNWPPRSEDPARYRILRRVAVNEVRALREEDYLDDDEVVEIEDRDEDGVVVGTHDEENPLAREYRLLMSEVTNQMKELGLTPKEQQKMGALESEADKNDAITEVANDALGGDEEYDPAEFDE